MAMNIETLRERLNDLHTEGQQFSFERFPKDSTYEFFLGDPPADWGTWVQRSNNLIKKYFKADSVPYLLISKGVRAAIALKGNGKDLFDRAKSDILSGLELCLRVTEDDVHNELQDLDTSTAKAEDPRNIFIGHGRSHIWKDLKDFIQDSLNLPWDEFNRESSAGISIKERLEEMLTQSSFAFLIMTAEDEHADQTLHARENVIHEVGLFQGKLGFKRAIVLLEEGCTEFSNIHGIGQIRFPTGNVIAVAEEIRRVLKREGILRNISLT